VPWRHPDLRPQTSNLRPKTVDQGPETRDPRLVSVAKLDLRPEDI